MNLGIKLIVDDNVCFADTTYKQTNMTRIDNMIYHRSINTLYI